MEKKFIEYRIENTNICGYRCVMCPREKQTRKLGFMSLKDFHFVLTKLPHNNRATIHLHGYGEPLLDKTLPQKVALLKAYPWLDSMIITTLGIEVEDAYFELLIKNGLKQILVSLYGFTETSYQATHRANKLELVKKNLRTLARIKKKNGSNLIIAIKIQAHEFQQSLIQLGKESLEQEARDAFIEEFKELGFQIQEIHNWHNYGDGRTYNRQNSNVCPVIFGRRSQILNITWDLNVIPCCFDYNSTIKFGNLRNMSIEEIFSSSEYKEFFLSQIKQDYRNYPVCQGCEKLDYQ